MKKLISVLCTILILFQSIASSEEIPTYNQFLADYNYNFNNYQFFNGNVKLPYRSYVETKREDSVYQGTLVAWKIATFELNDLVEYTEKEVAFYETILYDVLSHGNEYESLSGSLEKAVKTVQASSMQKVTEFFSENIKSFKDTPTSSLTTNELSKLNEALQSCEELTDVFKAIGGVEKVLGYVDNIEELFYKLAKVQSILENSNETVNILNMMKANTSNIAFSIAIDNMILALSEIATPEGVAALFASEVAASELLEYFLDEIWDVVLKNAGLAGFAIEAAQGAGKALTSWLFSTDESIEMYYSLCALYEFEDALKATMSTIEKRYLSSKTDSNSSLFNEAYRMLLKTYVFGAKAGQKYVHIEYKQGAISSLLRSFEGGDYDSYVAAAEDLIKDIECSIEVIDTIVYSSYIESYCADSADVLSIEPEEPAYSEAERAETIERIGDYSYTLNDLEITSDMTLTKDIHTYGSVVHSGGTLNLNSHTLKIDGDYTIDYSYAMLNMTNSADKLIVGGNFKTYSRKSHSGYLTAGEMILYGDFTASCNGNSSSFHASETHTIIFAGEDVQNIHFSSRYDFKYSGFANVKFQNDKINITSQIRGFKLSEDAKISNTTELEIYGALDLNGYTLTIPQNLTHSSGTIKLNGGTLKIDGDYTLISSAMLNMTNDADKLIVTGDLNIDIDKSHTYYLTAGEIILYGDFLQENGAIYGFDTSGTHTVIFAGEDVQSIYFTFPSSSGFANVKFQNDKINIESSIKGFKLLEDTKISNTSKLDIYGTLDLNGYTLTIPQSLTHSSGTIKLNGGTLKIDGDYTLISSAMLNMTNDADKLIVTGDLNIDIDKSHTYYLTAGEIILYGDFLQENGAIYGFDTSGTHTVIFAGEDVQSISFESPDYSGFAHVKITNTQSCSFDTKINISGTLTQPGGAKINGRENVYLQGKSAFTDYGELNTAINATVGNAENVIPTWIDYENYLNSLTVTAELKDINFSDEKFTGSVLIDNNKEDINNAKCIIAVYSGKNLLECQSKPVTISYGSTEIVNFAFEKKANTSVIKVFLWNNNIIPIAFTRADISL